MRCSISDNIGRLNLVESGPVLLYSSWSDPQLIKS